MTENPDGQYKFCSVDVNVDKSFIDVNRSVYGILDWLGDMGGLTDGVKLIL